MKCIGRKINVFMCPKCGFLFEYGKADMKIKHVGAYKKPAIYCCNELITLENNRLSLLEINDGCTKTYIKL